MDSFYIAISIVALIIIVALLILTRERGKIYSKPSNLATLGISLVVLGIIFSEEPVVGYSFIGIGVLLSIVDAYKNRQK